MHIEFRRSGGIAGIDLTADADTHELPDEQAKIAAELMNPDNSPAPPTSTGGPPDTFSYALSVTDGEHSTTHHWSESDVPDTVRPLLAHLSRRAQPAPPS